MNQKRIFSKFAMAIAVFALISGGVSAQKKETRHYLGGWLYGGYSAMFHSFDNTSVLGGAGGGFGLGYQLRRNQFIFNTGVEFEFLNSATKVTGIDGTFPIKDTQGKDVSFNAHFPSYRDHQKVTYLNLPILAGMQFNGDIPFYFLAGVKVGTPIKNTFSSNGTIRTDGWYEQYIDTFINMPNHYYKEQDFNGVKGVSIFSKINVMASVEFGVDINKYIFKEQEAAKKAKQKAKKSQPKVKGKKQPQFEEFERETPRIRVALFADYGFLNANNNVLVPSNSVIQKPTTMTWFSPNGVIAEMLPTYNLLSTERAFGSDYKTRKSVNPFIVGVKGTIFFDVTKPKKIIPPPPIVKPTPPPPPPVIPITGKVINIETNQEVPGVAVDMFDLKKNNAKVFSVAKTATGVFNTKLDRKGSYRVTVKAPNYQDYTEEVSNVGDTLMIYIEPFRSTDVFVVRNIYFVFDKKDLIATSNVALDSMANFMKENPGIKFKVEGHTDRRGSAAYNARLSNERAQEVVKALVARGIDESRLTFEGMGASVPLCTDETEECHGMNRRVEFRITDVE